MLNKRANHYGSAKDTNFTNALEKQASQTWLKQFDPITWTLHLKNGPDKKHSGLQVHAAKMAEMLAFLMGSKTLKPEIEKSMHEALQKLVDRALY